MAEQLAYIPPEAYQEPIQSFRTNFEQYDVKDELSDVDRLQQKWDMQLDTYREDKTELIRSYNPVLARWKFEQCESDVDRGKFARYEIAQQITNLRERYHASTSRYHYLIDEEGKLRNEYFPDEPFEESVKRGIEWRQQNGSQELEREIAELEGFLKIQHMVDAPVGTTALSLSGPGIVGNERYKSGYPKNFVDVFKVIEDESGEKTIQTTRYESSLSYEQYRSVAEYLQSGYFEGESGPIDAWLLSHPIIKEAGELPDTADEIFEKFFDKPVDVLKEEEMQEIIEYCLPYILYLMKTLTTPEFNPEKIALAFNTLLIKGDKAHTNVMRKREGKSMLETHDAFYLDIEREVEVVGRQQVEVRDAGCGDSAGFAMGVENSVAQFGFRIGESTEDQYGSRLFNCPDCKRQNIRPVNVLLPKCQHCGSEAVSCKPGDKKKEKSKVASTRTEDEEQEKGTT